MRINWLYLANRSERASEPVLICPQLVATARSAMVVFLGFARAMRHHGGIAGAMRHVDGGERLGQRADLVDLDEDRIGDPFLDAAREAFDVGDEQVVADELGPCRRSSR